VIKNIGIIERALQEVYSIVTLETLNTINKSISRRINMCIRNKGRAAKY
jgi:hypothetical protein